MQGASGSARFCSSCGAATQVGARFCANCGASVGPTGGQRPSPTGGGPSSYGRAYPTSANYERTYGTGSWMTPHAEERDRTRTGLLLLVIGFLLAWVPYVSLVGGLLGLIGLIFLFLGRRGYGESHRRYVVAAGVLFVVAFVGVLILSLSFAASVLSQANASGVPLSQIGSEVKADLLGFLYGGLILAAVGGLAHVLIIYRISDRTSHYLLWTAFVLAIAISLATLVYLVPLLSTAIDQATSGGTFNSAPINRFETTNQVVGLLAVFPSLLNAWAYYRTRAQLETVP